MDSKVAREIFEATLSASIAYREKFSREVPFSFLLVAPDGTVGHVSAIPGITEDQLKEVVLGLAQKHGAEYILTVGEAWTSESRDPLTTWKAREKVVMVTIEGPDLKLLATVRVSPSGGILGQAKVVENFEGKFSELAGLSEDYN